MDQKLVAWALTVKPGRHPPLWLFTDRQRVPDVLAAIRALPVGYAGVVLRGVEDLAPGLARRVAVLCRGRGIALSVAGSGRGGQPGTGLHLSRGQRRAGPRPRFVTSSAHDAAERAAARRCGASLIFLSPVFPTASHSGAVALGTRRWTALARHDPSVGALGGITGQTVGRLPGRCRQVGAIGALLPDRRLLEGKVA